MIHNPVDLEALGRQVSFLSELSLSELFVVNVVLVRSALVGCALRLPWRYRMCGTTILIYKTKRRPGESPCFINLFSLSITFWRQEAMRAVLSLMGAKNTFGSAIRLHESEQGMFLVLALI